MRVIAFSCVHLMTRALQTNIYEYEQPLDYEPFHKLLSLILADPPDAVVNLGDFTETYWGDTFTLPVDYVRLMASKKTKLIKIAGNHDPADGYSAEMVDRLRYEHGHKLVPNMPGADSSTDGYTQRLRENTAGMRLVHGHSHVPTEAWPLDVGSATFSQTYGEIIDGVPNLRRL